MIVRFSIRISILAALTAAFGTPHHVGAQGTVSGTLLRGSRSVASAVVQLIPVVQQMNSGADTALIDQSHLRFTPAVVPLEVGSTIEFLNSDPIMHNVFGPGREESAFDLGTFPQGESRFRTFDQVGSHIILCHVHPEMVAWVVVSPSAFSGVTRDDGGFVVDSVPAGSYDVRVWHRRWTHEAGRLDVPVGGVSRWTIRAAQANGETGR